MTTQPTQQTPAMVFQDEAPTPPPTEHQPTTPATSSPEPVEVPSPKLQNSNPTTPKSSTGEGMDDGSASGHDSTETSADKPASNSKASGSFPTSSPANPLSTKALEDAITHVVATASQTAHQMLTRGDEYAEQVGLWLADEQDVHGVAGPTSKILARRGVIVGGGADASDFVAVAFALLGYTSKQVNKLFALRQIRKSQAQAAQQAGTGTAPADQP